MCLATSFHKEVRRRSHVDECEAKNVWRCVRGVVRWRRSSRLGSALRKSEPLAGRYELHVSLRFGDGADVEAGYIRDSAAVPEHQSRLLEPSAATQVRWPVQVLLWIWSMV